MAEKKLRPLTHKQHLALYLLRDGRPLAAPRIGGEATGEALVKRGLAVPGPLMMTSMITTARGTSATLQASYTITTEGYAALVELDAQEAEAKRHV